MQTSGNIPGYRELEADPILDEGFRAEISAYDDKKKKIRQEKTAKAVFDLLESYRKKRVLYNVAKSTIDKLKGEAVDVDSLIQAMGDNLAVATSAVSTIEQLVHIGEGNNSVELVKEILDGEGSPTIPTGFKTFDDKNGGFFKQAVAVLSSNSSGGKSVCALQMAINMYWAGQSTCVLSLEMSKDQYMARFLSNISGVSASRIFLKKLTEDEKNEIRAAYKKFVIFGKKNNVRWTILAPETGLSLDQLLMTCKPYSFDVVTIDYATLLEEADVDNQARALASITRRCKVFSQVSKCLVIVLAQLSDDGFIKYSRAIKENADHVWTWTFSDTERETHNITIKVDKGRNQMCFPFEVTEDFSTMRIIDNGPVRSFDEDTENEFSTKKKKKEKEEPEDDYLAEDDI
jgi:hypothetical protein